MKYKKIGPQEFVDFDFEEFTFMNIKKACLQHFAQRLPSRMVCDILATQNGPSCSKLSHITKL